MVGFRFWHSITKKMADRVTDTKTNRTKDRMTDGIIDQTCKFAND